MMHPATTQALALDRLAELHHQAQRAALARAACRARPAQPARDHAPGILAALTGQAPRRRGSIAVRGG
jgi:hypothetical protein